MMDAVSDPAAHTIVLQTSAQVGKSEIILNTLGFHIDQDPAPMLVIQPTLEMAEAFSKDRIAPMIRDTPALSGKVKDPKARDSSNTVRHKVFPGGHLTLAGANSPSSLAMRPVRIVLFDEVDRFPISAGDEGDPVQLATKRSTTFYNRKRIMTSTPTIKGQSRIEYAYQESDMRQFHVPCPHCEHKQVLKWAQVRWPKDHPRDAEYCCIECGTLWSDAERWKAVNKGEWIAQKPFKGIAGFHLSELYSPWVKLGSIAEDFVAVHKVPELLKVWTNTSLGETFEEKGETIEDSLIDTLRENYDPDLVSNEALFITFGADTQKDRLEVEFVAWGREEESWGVGYHTIRGDPSQNSVWEELDEIILKTNFQTEDGRRLIVEGGCVDSGGHHSEAVLRYCATRGRRRIYAVKGQGGQGKPIWPLRASKSKHGNMNVYLIGVDTAKDAIHSRLTIDEPGPGYCHIMADPSSGYDNDWAEQIASEQKMTRYREGRAYNVWVLPAGKRNEALDCRVYALAAYKAVHRIALARAMRAQRVQTPPPERIDKITDPVKKTPVQDNWLGGRTQDWLSRVG